MAYKEFIINKINNLVEHFPSIKVSYEDHSISGTQMIEVIPSNFYWNDDAFQTIENEIVLEFCSLFPDQTLCFITEDARVGLGNIDYEKAGKKYDEYLAYAEKISDWDIFIVEHESNAIYNTIYWGINVVIDNQLEPLGETNYQNAA